MPLTNDELKRLARLARVRVEESELDGFRDKISAVIQYVAKLQEVDTEGVPEIAHGAGETNTFRDDVVEGCAPQEREHLLAAFPHRFGDLLEVQGVFETRTE